MDDRLIEQRLRLLDKAVPPDGLEVRRLLGYRGGGMFHSYNVEVEGQSTPYIAKWPDHEQPASCHRLIVELSSARLADLLGEHVVPPHAVLRVQQHHVLGVSCQQCNRSLQAGPVFGSRTIANVQEARGRIPGSVPATRAAQIIIFQTWLEAADTQMLYDGRAYSMDHAQYLRGCNTWITSGCPDPLVDASPLITALERSITDPTIFASSLQRLDELTEEEIVDCFGAAPVGWWGALSDRRRLAAYVLARRPLVRAAIIRQIHP